MPARPAPITRVQNLGRCTNRRIRRSLDPERARPIIHAVVVGDGYGSSRQLVPHHGLGVALGMVGDRLHRVQVRSILYLGYRLGDDRRVALATRVVRQGAPSPRCAPGGPLAPRSTVFRLPLCSPLGGRPRPSFRLSTSLPADLLLAGAPLRLPGHLILPAHTRPRRMFAATPADLQRADSSRRSTMKRFAVPVTRKCSDSQR